MSTAVASQELVVWADKEALPQARHEFSQLGKHVRTVPLESSKKFPDSRVFIFYLYGREPRTDLHSAIKILKSWRKKNLDLVVFYTPHHSANLAFEAGMLVGRETGGSANWAFDLRGVKQLLRARNLLINTEKAESARSSLDLAAVRRRLGLTQEQMAHALNVATRTLQNWEKKIGISHLVRKTRDLRELLELMDDYVSSPEERDWLNAPLAAFQNQRPIDLIAEGKLRDLIIEFQRLREGQPL
jgi:DNA-binding XRE family transcriptional regulator